VKRFARDEGGSVAILVAISMVVVCMSGAMAVDLGNMAQLHRHASYTAEDAAISGADLLEQGTDSLTQIISATEGYIDENWRNLPSSAWDTCPDIPTGFSAPSGSLENCVTFNGTSTATATAINVEFPPQSVPFTLARLGGFMSGNVEASASAVIVPGTAPCALCVLGPSGLTLNDIGSGSFTVTDTSGNAGIVVNSTASGSGTGSAAYINGSGTISAPQINLVGTYGVKHSGTFQPTPTTGVSPVSDPLGGLAPPTPTPASATTIPTATYSCTSACPPLPPGMYGNVSLGGNGTLSIPPGNYNNIGVIGSAVLTLEPGTYFISGSFSVGGTGGASVYESEGVLLYFTCSSSGQLAACASGGAPGGSLSLSGTGSMTLEPTTTGTYAGLTIFYDRNNNAPMTLSGTPGLSITGTIYAKSSTLALNGNGDTLASYIIVNSATINGNGNIGVNYNASQNIAPPGTPYLCSTAANNC
jgi:hypothetical protein